jgi:DNA-binding MarR family transcriptional regulator
MYLGMSHAGTDRDDPRHESSEGESRAPVDDFVRRQGLLTLGTRLKRLGERMQADVGRLARREGVDVPVGLLPVLGALHQYGSLTVGELARAIGIAQPGVTRGLGRLERMGLVELSRGVDDQRRRHVALTAHGSQEVSRMRTDLWPRVSQAVEEVCAVGDEAGVGTEGTAAVVRTDTTVGGGRLLALLAGIEDALDAAPLDVRAGAGGQR